MKHFKSLFTAGIISIILLSCFLVGNVSGAWHYAMNASGEIQIPISVEVFPWEGVDQLPHDVFGENHQKLIETILNGTYTDENGTTTQIGLNNPDSYISNEIDSRANGNFFFRSDLLGSMDFWERNDIAKFFDTETSGLTFLIHFPDGESNTYYVYTTGVVLGDSSPNIPIGEKIYPVYRTELHKGDDGVWKAVETKTGYAESAYYQNPVTGSYLLKYPSFNPDTWVETELGTSTSDAIYAYVGQTVTSYSTSANSAKYYKISVSSAKTININSENTSAKSIVYNTQMSAVQTNGGSQGTNSLSFRASSNTTYYIEVSGSTSITFTIS